MEIINPEEEPLDWDKFGKKRRDDTGQNPWHPDRQFPNHPDSPGGPNPYRPPGDPLPHHPGKPYPPDDDPWPGRKKEPNPYGPPGDPHKRQDPHKRREPSKKTTCPGCGGTGEVHEDHRVMWSGDDPTEGALDTHRGHQRGRKGHFGAGHQKLGNMVENLLSDNPNILAAEAGLDEVMRRNDT